MANLKQNNDMAVSPIVATLVLIVVAVIGAVAVGTIMGTFSTDVSKQANADQAKSTSQTEIVLAGSTTVQPVAEQIAKIYMTANPGVKITVQGGGSGAGVQAAALNLADIGTSSDLAKITGAQSTYPDLTPIQIGGSGVVVITNSATPAITSTVGNITRSALFMLYTNGTTTGADFTGTPVAYQRAESSGTEETFAKWITKGSASQLSSLDTTSAKTASGNAGILAAVQNNAGAIGFVDIGYAYDSNGNVVSGIKILGVQEDLVSATTVTAAAETIGISTSPNSAYSPKKANVLAGTKDLLNGKSQNTNTNTNYPQGLCRGLYYITNGAVPSTVQNFITFSQGNGANDAIHAAGVFSNVDLSAF
jgi:phosphate transport system substrate-binding protein